MTIISRLSNITESECINNCLKSNVVKQQEKSINHLVYGYNNIFARIFNIHCILNNENSRYEQICMQERHN